MLYNINRTTIARFNGPFRFSLRRAKSRMFLKVIHVYPSLYYFSVTSISANTETYSKSGLSVSYSNSPFAFYHMSGITAREL